MSVSMFLLKKKILDSTKTVPDAVVTDGGRLALKAVELHDINKSNRYSAHVATEKNSTAIIIMWS